MKIVKSHAEGWMKLAGWSLVALVCSLAVTTVWAGEAKPPTNAPGAAKPAAAPAPPAAPVAWKFPTSTFVALRDPFYPDSIRITGPSTGPGVNPTPVPPVVPKNPYDYLKVTSLLGGRRPSVSINTISMTPGETNNVVVNIPNERSVTYQVICLEIKARSVRIKVIGQAEEKELFLKD